MSLRVHVLIDVQYAFLLYKVTLIRFRYALRVRLLGSGKACCTLKGARMVIFILGERLSIVKISKPEHLGGYASIFDYNFVQFFLYELNERI